MLEAIALLQFPDTLSAQEDLSAIASINQGFIIGGDEGHVIDLLKRDHNNCYYQHQSLRLVRDATEKEADIEDICCLGFTCYVVGSHSRKRKKMKPKQNSQAENRQRLYQPPQGEPNREVLFRLTLDPQTEYLTLQQTLSLSDVIQSNALLQTFLPVPSKENGIDIEGLAIRGDRLFIGFRSPVLRGNYVPVLSVDAQTLAHPKLTFIQMDGRGIRAMTETQDGFLVIGGPAGDAKMSYHLYFWDGNDMIPGHDLDPQTSLTLLGEIPSPPQAKAEGLTILSETEHQWQVLILYDGITGGQPTVFKIAKP